ncbi:MAG: hypothetical protein LRY53_05915 [Burkholderiaceae bacterium]|nr:hypothetical protein [Burkholderiaceae bacterium]
MADSSSRRSFLFGRQATAHDEWSKFVVTLRRCCQGTVKLVTQRSAHLKPATLDDVIKARKLCHTHQIVMALDGLDLPVSEQGKFVLRVEAGSAWGSLIPLGDTGLWRVDAGCPMAVMQAAGLVQATESPKITNLAQWYASAYRYQPLTGSGLADGLVSVDWLLPDGTIEVFGAFGANDAQPLGSLAAQKLVPTLFELSLRPEVQDCLAQGHWPSRFHLDALMDMEHVNLAHFFIGHAGALGWLVAATFKKTEAVLGSTSGIAVTGGTMTELDQLVKRTVDPQGVFVSLADQTR